MDLEFTVRAFVTLLSVIDPVAAVPIYLSMTLDHSPASRRIAARRAPMAATVVLLFFLFFGDAVFRAFSISPAAFRIAGGLIILIIALDLLKATHTGVRIEPSEKTEGTHKADVSITPLGIPLLGGPGAISTVVVFSSERPDTTGTLTLVAILLAIGVLTWLALRFSRHVLRLLGVTGINVVSRLFGLIVLAMAVQFILDGLRETAPTIFTGG